MEEPPQSGLWETLRTVFYAILIAGVIRVFAYEPFNIPSGSMIPTLLVGDYLFVSKFSYGYSRYSLPFSLPLIEDRIFFTPPKRGDVAVFKLPHDNKTDYIKRIVGLPGDRIQVKEGLLYINGDPVERESDGEYTVSSATSDSMSSFMRLTQYKETLPSGMTHPIVESSDSGPLDNTPEFLVPQGHYFAMGDNRDNSLDSRVATGVGFIPEKNLVGQAKVIFFSQNGGAKLWEIWKWPFAVRYSRLFSTIN